MRSDQQGATDFIATTPAISPQLRVRLLGKPGASADHIFSFDLDLAPQVVEFEGFINYGSPIQITSTDAHGRQVVNVITPSVINQPIFSTAQR